MHCYYYTIWTFKKMRSLNWRQRGLNSNGERSELGNVDLNLVKKNMILQFSNYHNRKLIILINKTCIWEGNITLNSQTSILDFTDSNKYICFTCITLQENFNLRQINQW